MLVFYTLFSFIIFLWLGTALILQRDNKVQGTVGSLFIGAGVLGILCLIIEVLIFKGGM